MMRATFLFIVLSAGWSAILSAQNLSPTVLAPAGSAERNDQLQLEWTLGEIAVDASAIQNHLFTEGFHQPYLTVEPATASTTAPDPEEQAKWMANVTVAPNPVNSTLTVQFKELPQGSYQLSLTSPEGKLLLNETMSAGEQHEELNLARFESGMYYLQVRSMDGRATH
ncbi:MAG TPA: T9SS type A sorting domain-containing protein, partial [Saprospiraceae bacterium]|nr:T9SS type A sorting domain-containing protein [Saprospiraceae bacterium]